jgi:shikimate kinase
LTGMPGVGKSTVGVLLAKVMCRDFIDTDLHIQSRENRTLRDIIDNEGMAFFRKVEERYVIALSCHNSIIATGGSVVYSEKAMKHLQSLGTVLHLFLPLEFLRARLSNFSERGIVRRPDQDLSDLFRERIPLYRKYSRMEIDCAARGHDELVSLILAKLGERNSETPHGSQ